MRFTEKQRCDGKYGVRLSSIEFWEPEVTIN